MLLADFIVAHLEPILLEWEVFARGIRSGEKMDALALRDHADEILLATVRDMRIAQSAAQRLAKSRQQYPPTEVIELNGASEQHAIGRLGSGFDLLELVSEYRALRASVLRLWHENGARPHANDVDDVSRFNESIDESLAKAVKCYTQRVNQSRDLFLAILSHDLRNPLNSITMSASLLAKSTLPTNETSDVAAQITTNASVMGRMISDLLDYTRTRLGAGMPVSAAPMDLGDLGQELHREFRTAHPNREINYQATGDLRGNWDSDRLRQAISNLLGNAIQHTATGVVVDLAIHGDPTHVQLIVHNGGPPIPSGELAKIFDPLVRGSSADTPLSNRPGSIGLGLYIARAIAESHGGTLEVDSTEETGTDFTLRPPSTLSSTRAAPSSTSSKSRPCEAPPSGGDSPRFSIRIADQRDRFFGR